MRSQLLVGAIATVLSSFVVVPTVPSKESGGGVPRSLIFFTPGEAIRKVSASHVPYAEKAGVWQRGLIQFKQPLEQTWKPYLNGKGTRDEALSELINS